MSASGRRLTWILASRFARRGTGVQPVALVSCTTALVVAVFIALQSLSLSGRQEIDKRLGSFESTAALGSILSLSPPEARAVPEVTRAAQTVDARAAVFLQSYDVQPASSDPPTTYYTEGPWAEKPFDDRYRLTEGRWPTGPGEIVVAETSTGSLADPGDRLAVLSGRDSLEVVGLVDDRFGNYRATILAAPGTFATLDSRTAPGSIPALALPSLYWTGAEPDRILGAVADVVAERYELDLGEVRASLQASTESSYDVAAAREESWIDQIPAAYLIPSVVLPLVATLGAFGLMRRRHHRAQVLLSQVGVPRRLAASALGLASGLWIGAGLILGLLGGLALGIATRSYLASTTFQPLSPMPGLARPVLTIVIVTIIGSFLATASLRTRVPRSDDHTVQPNHAPSRPSRLLLNVRHALATLLLCASLLLASQLTSTPRAMVLAGLATATVLAMTPELAAGALRLAPARGPRTRLARQQLRADPSRATLAVIVLATALALPLGFIMLLGTLSASAATNGNQSAVGPGQVALSGLGGTLEAPPAEVVAAARTAGVLPDDEIQLRYLADGPNFASFGVAGAGLGVVWAVDSTDDLADLRGASTSEQERATLEQGGILVWDDQEGNSRTLVDADGEALPGATLTASPGSLDPAWEASSVGVVLTDTANDLSLPTAQGALVYTGVNDSDALLVRESVLNSRLDPGQVQTYSSPEPPYVPQAFQLAAVALLLIGLSTGLVFSRAQVQVLRRYSSTLLALGLPSRWVRQVLVLQNIGIVAVASVVAVATALIPTVISASVVPGFILDVPWARLAVVLLAFFASILIATVISVGRLSATDRGLS